MKVCIKLNIKGILTLYRKKDNVRPQLSHLIKSQDYHVRIIDNDI